MEIKYLTETILPQRKHEIDMGHNLGTMQPIYVVLDLEERYVSGHPLYDLTTNRKGQDSEYGYIDLNEDSEARVFKKSPNRMIKPEEITRFYTDRIVAFFLTSKAAHSYLQYQMHNLQNGYVYVFHSGYRNAEMDNLLNGE